MRFRGGGVRLIPADTPLTAEEKLILIWSLGLSFCLIARMWLGDRGVSWERKLFWSAVLLIPVLGWVFYGGFYRRTF